MYFINDIFVLYYIRLIYIHMLVIYECHDTEHVPVIKLATDQSLPLILL